VHRLYFDGTFRSAARYMRHAGERLAVHIGGDARGSSRGALKITRSVMLADQLRDLQAYGQQRTAELGIEPGDVPARIEEFLKSSASHSGQ
jgi:hypothetical protein